MANPSLLNLNFKEVQENYAQIDKEALHLELVRQIEEGKYDTYIDALTAYLQENNLDIDLHNVQKYISSNLYEKIYREALDSGMVKEVQLQKTIEEFF